jgi:hypothetical protein
VEAHWTILLLGVSTTVAIVHEIVDSPLIGVVVFLANIVMWYVVSIVWMRPRGYDEHNVIPPPQHPGRARSTAATGSTGRCLLR